MWWLDSHGGYGRLWWLDSHKKKGESVVAGQPHRKNDRNVTHTHTIRYEQKDPMDTFLMYFENKIANYGLKAQVKGTH